MDPGLLLAMTTEFPSEKPPGARFPGWLLPPLLAAACLAVLLLAVFQPVLFRDHQFAFQDAGHFYYPLLERVQQEWDAGRWPLWAPEASAGTPLLGNPTAAVLYPGKLVFFVLPHRWAVRVFLVGHVALAFASMWAMLRGWGVSAVGSALGALAYAFGVPVLSQTSNMIFLVGAAWAPLGFLAADRWARLHRRSALPCLSLILAMQVLGGDPEAAYLTLAASLGYSVGLSASRPTFRSLAVGLGASYIGLLGMSWWAARAIRRRAIETESGFFLDPPRDALVAAAWLVLAAFVARLGRYGRDPAGTGVVAGGLIGAAVLGLAITGAQLLPVVEYGSMSFRAAEMEGFHDIYPYSANPLQLLDAVWPGFFGRSEAGYRSWINALPPKPNSRLWMPSVYLGGTTLIFAVAAFGFRGGQPHRAWLSAVTLVSLLAAMGYYASPVLWARCVPGGQSLLGPLEPAFSWQVRKDGCLRDGDGGVYWFLASALPGFGTFRYPPKLLVFSALGVAGLAGLGWDKLVAGRSRRAEIVGVIILVSSAAILAGTWAVEGRLRAGFDQLAASLGATDEPLDIAWSIADLRWALGHGLVVSAIGYGLVRAASRRPLPAGAIAVTVLIADLWLANASRVVTVPQAVFEGTPSALALIQEAERSNPSPGPFRVGRVGRWWPLGWAGSQGPRGFSEITRWERDTLRPNFQLPLGVASTFYLDTIEPLDYGLFFLPWSLTPDPRTARAYNLKPDQRVWYHPRRGYDLWNTRYFIVPNRTFWANPSRDYAAMLLHSTVLYPSETAFDGPDGLARRDEWERTQDFRILRNDAAYPRAWIVHHARVLPEIRGLKVADRTKVMQELLYQDDPFWRLPGQAVRDPHALAWIETDRPAEVARFLSQAAPDPTESVKVVREESQRVEIEAVLKTPGVVVVADMYYPGWRVSVDGEPGEIFRTNRAMRGVGLKAGTHHLVLEYRPLSVRLGLLLSGIGMASWCGLVVASRRRSASEGRT